jgi:hypothetical protein
MQSSVTYVVFTKFKINELNATKTTQIQESGNKHQFVALKKEPTVLVGYIQL